MAGLAPGRYLLVIYRRVPLRRTHCGRRFIGLHGDDRYRQYFDGVMPIWFWVIGMLLAFAGMWAIILFGAGTGKREGMYIAARAFVLAELVASLHWQLVMFLNLGENPERAQLFCTAVTGGHVRRLLHGGVANRTRQFCQ